jgi:undecaprenyl-phosphate 4-deoxy-4-formamido-L-arabinose transferase
MDWPGVSVVVPVFQSTTTLGVLVDRLDVTLAPLGSYEVILVDDGSQEATWSTIDELSDRWPQVIGVRLGRNYGQHNALVAGIREASFPVTVTIDDDLQNPPEEIPRLVNTLLNDNLDVVYGVPERVEQSVPRKLAGRITRLALSSGLGVDSAPDVSSFRAFRTRTRDAFASDLGTNVSLDALLTWGSGRFGSVRVRHDPRNIGTSNYTFGKLLRFAIDTTTGYSTLPLQLASILGLATAAFGLVVLVVVVVRPLISGQSVPGFPFLAATIAIFSGAQLLTLGVIGEYLARMHFRIMRKPTYVISETTRNEAGQP